MPTDTVTCQVASGTCQNPATNTCADCGAQVCSSHAYSVENHTKTVCPACDMNYPSNIGGDS
jgi:hypothetical protein